MCCSVFKGGNRKSRLGALACYEPFEEDEIVSKELLKQKRTIEAAMNL